ncbi:MAG: S4 domain-containing protein, partial [Clostridia bacterium]
MDQWEEAVAGEEQRGQRLDQYVSALCEDCSRSRVQILLEKGHITVNSQPEKANYRIRPGDVVRWSIPEPEMLSAEPEPMDLEIVYEDESLAVVNKPRGLVVHPAAGHASGTLVNGLMYHFQGNLSAING